MVDDPTNPGGPQVCADKKGGISQLCCSNDSTRPCHPTAAEGGIVRTGLFTPLSPAWNQPGYPKSTNSVFASVFCEPRTGNPPIDVITTGLPGPGALLLSVTQTFTKAQ